MLKNKQNTIFTIIGHKGHGKTKLTEIITLLNNRPAIMVDPGGQYEKGSRSRRRIFDKFGEFRAWIYNAKNLHLFYQHKLELVIREPDDQEFDEICKIVRKVGRCTFVVDETDMYAPPTITKKSAFYKLVNMGRHSLVDIITTSRRPARISRDITSQTDIIMFSKMYEPNDHDYIKRYIGESYIDTVKKLDMFSFLMIDNHRKANILKVSKQAAEAI